MNIQKHLNEISLQITEKEYRELNSLSYSTISRFNREGFANLDSLFDPISSPSLTLGSLVDCLITEGLEEYNNRYVVVDMPAIPEKIKDIIDLIFKEQRNEDGTLKMPNLLVAPQKLILEYADKFEYYPKYKPETRVKGIIEKGGPYYNMLSSAQGKKIITMQQHNDAWAMYNVLKESKATKWFFTPNPFEAGIERHYQLKFKAALQYAIPYKCMFDLIIVNHNTKEILPIDLKTTGKPEYEFYHSFVDWNYHMQARLYTRILENVIKQDEYFKDFKVLNYKFIVVNKTTLTPLVWDFPMTHAIGDIECGKLKNIILKDPEVIGKELYGYLKYKPSTPDGINPDKGNNLIDWLNTL